MWLGLIPSPKKIKNNKNPRWPGFDKSIFDKKSKKLAEKAYKFVPKIVNCPPNVYFKSRRFRGIIVSKAPGINIIKHNSIKIAGMKKGPTKRKAFDTHSKIPFFSFFGATRP